MRALRFTIALVLAIVVGIAGASAVIGSPGPTSEMGPEAVQPDGTGAAIAATAADPAAAHARSAAVAPSWAVRVYRSQAGYTCPDAGRSLDGDFGRVDGDGSFHPLALGASGNCIDLTEDQYSIDVSHYPANEERGARAVVFGVVTPAVRSVAVTVDGTRTDLEIADGAFVTALDDADAGSTQVDVTLADGTTKTQALRPSTLVADGAQP
ncbi:hypothetical protein DSM104299_01219 [Baekduia alba]|uniref:hypothetical protein n=1 Tax=Baekduia alba TaxID=2997333 RepID=UPI0023408F5A|nr:hypothetical protein [Baekduia alba]WCB92523.1 hypothetical protein DSM104299_01219 [Baekduia alba]